MLLWDVNRYLARRPALDLPGRKARRTVAHRSPVRTRWRRTPRSRNWPTARRRCRSCAKHMRPVPKPDPVRVAALIRDLDSDDFETREKATRELALFGDVAAPALREAAKSSSPETRRRANELLAPLESWRYPLTKGEALRSVRAIEVLEHSGTAEARQLLKALASGAAEHHLTREAAAALRRLNRR